MNVGRVSPTHSALIGAQAQAEQRAGAAAQEGTGKRLREAEARCEALEETIEEMRVSMDRQRATFEMRCAVRD